MIPSNRKCYLFQCPQCYALPGEKCSTPRGLFLKTPEFHAKRVKRAENFDEKTIKMPQGGCR